MTPRKFDRYMVAIGMGTHQKFARLTDGEFRAHVVGVLSVAATAPIRGCLLVGDLPANAIDVAVVAGVSEKVARSAMDKLRAVGILVPDEEHGCYRVHDWEDINPPPKTDAGNAERQRRFRERNGSSNDTITPHVTTPEVEVEVEAPATQVNTSLSGAVGADEKVTDEDRRLCALFRDLALERNPKFKVKSPSRWLTDMRLLREKDDNSAEEIDRVIRWAFKDEFWGGVIQSPGNLREHFPKIWDRMHQTKIVPLRPSIQRTSPARKLEEMSASAQAAYARMEAKLEAEDEGVA